MTRSHRLPDFIVIGAMKSGTSTLYRWLAEQPEMCLPERKEWHFFSRDPVWARGVDWYASLFADAPRQLVGEASTSYTNPDHCEVAARRMAAVVPGARLVYLLRHPVERLRSHYRDAVLQGEEHRPLAEVMADPRNRLLRRSLYHTCLAPYTTAFPREQILVVRFEDLIAPEGEAWGALLAHLGLPERPAPTTAYNVSAERPQYGPAVRRLVTSRLGPHTARVPEPLRRLARPLLASADPERRARLESSRDAIPEEHLEPLWDDVARLERWLGRTRPLWERPAPPVGER